MTERFAPGWPGLAPTWTSSSKSGVGTSLRSGSRVWFTVSHGIINEVYYPRIDKACIRDMELIVTDGRDFFSEEKRHSRSEVTWIAPGVPAFRLLNTCLEGRYSIDKLVLSDPHREVLLQKICFTPLRGSLSDYHLYVLAAPHLGNFGSDNTAWFGDYKGVPMLMAERDGHGLAIACSSPWLKRSVGFVGSSDGWQDLKRNRRIADEFTRAENGNVALVGEIDLRPNDQIALALGFGTNTSEAAQRAHASLIDGFDSAQEAYVADWQAWQKSLATPDVTPAPKVYQTSAAVLRIHEDKSFPGGIIASLSIPWGFSKGDEDLGGYHLVWPRDLVETAGALVAVGAREDALRVLNFLQSTQDGDGHWPQNMWLDGSPYWSGVQMDETAFPILLVELLQREDCLGGATLAAAWPMVRNAAAFLVANGPVTQQDRWEEDAGYSPFTLATEIAALIVAADLADLHGEPVVAQYFRETADTWNDSIEKWTYVTDAGLAAACGVDGYYVRITPPPASDSASPLDGFVAIKNRPIGQDLEPIRSTVSTEFLALVRFGLRSPRDPRILNTLKVIDALLKMDTPQGPLWHRYNDDGYGEHEDGDPFDGSGKGRLWPLLSGERAHYELAAGNVKQADRLRQTLEACAGEGDMIPEQTWDASDIPEKELWFGRPSGSARPLVWAHAEYIKLVRSLQTGRIFDQPRAVSERYIDQRRETPFASWRFNNRCRRMAAGRTLRVEATAPFMLHWSSDGWHSNFDVVARDTTVGIYVVDLPTRSMPSESTIQFTFKWTADNRWDGTNYSVEIV
jgi:glucoamylase